MPHLVRLDQRDKHLRAIVLRLYWVRLPTGARLGERRPVTPFEVPNRALMSIGLNLLHVDSIVMRHACPRT